MNTTGRIHEPERQSTKTESALHRGAAVVFVRRKAMMHIGHVGWGFLLRDGRSDTGIFSGLGGSVWEVGAVENHHGSIITSPLQDGYWRERTSRPLIPLAKRHYDHYKVIPVDTPCIQAAFEAEAHVRERPYIAAVGNCMNDVYLILSRYGVRSLPHPEHIINWVPNLWYRNIKADEYAIEDASGLDIARR